LFILDVKKANLVGSVKFLILFLKVHFFLLCESKFYYICGVLIYHIIYNFSLSKEFSKEQSKELSKEQRKGMKTA
jgi:uncharacterized membrane protein